MPPRGKRIGQAFAPQPVNTLNGRDSGDTVKRAQPQSHQDAGPTKRLRTEGPHTTSFFAPISSGSRDSGSARSDHHGSTESMSSNMVSGLGEFYSAASMRDRSRPPRHSSRARNRQRQSVQGNARGYLGHHLVRQTGQPRIIHDEIEDADGDQDELATNGTHFGQARGPIHPPNPPRAGVHIGRPFGGDEADVHFIRQQRNYWEQGRKGAPEEDEISVLPMAPPPVPPERHANPISSSTSLSHKGDISPTWKKKAPTLSIAIKSAFRLPRYRLHDQSVPARSVHLEEHPDKPGELHASGACELDQGSLSWLRIKTNRVVHIQFHEACRYVIIRLAAELDVGAFMGLEFMSHQDANELVGWYKDNSKVQQVVREPSEKLTQIFQKNERDVSSKIEQDKRRPVDDAHKLEHTGSSPNIVRTYSRSLHMQGSGLVQSRNPPRVRLIDTMKAPSPGEKPTTPAPDEGAFPHHGLPLDPLPQPRRSLRSVVTTSRRSFSPIARKTWTEENPDWEKDWVMPLVYDRTTVHVEDIPRLDEGQLLNDNLIMFGLRHLFRRYAKEHPGLEKRVYLFNSFFYENLRSTRDGQINYADVRSWTSKVDLLSYDYIIVPVHESFHWWAAIICNPGRLDPDVPRRSAQDDAAATPEKKEALSGGAAQEPSTDPSSDQVMLDAPLASERSNGVVAPAPAPASLEGDAATTTTNQPEQATCSETAAACQDELAVRIGSDIQGSSGTLVDQTEAEERSQPRHAKIQRPSKRAAPVRRLSPEDPRIITLDSLGSLGDSHSAAVRALKQYLVCEYADKRKKEIAAPTTFGMRAAKIPQQENSIDCGVYVLGYIEQFFKDPDGFVQGLLRREKPSWLIDSSSLRKQWRDLILAERDTYQQSQKEMQEQRKLKKAKKQQQQQQQQQEPEATKTSKPDAAPQAASLAAPAAHSFPATPRLPSPIISAPDETHTASGDGAVLVDDKRVATSDASATTPTAAAFAPFPVSAPPTTPLSTITSLAPAAVAPDTPAAPPVPPEPARAASPGLRPMLAKADLEVRVPQSAEAASSLPSQRERSAKKKVRRTCQPDSNSFVVCLDAEGADALEGDSSVVNLDDDIVVVRQKQSPNPSPAQRLEPRPTSGGVRRKDEIVLVPRLSDRDLSEIATPNRPAKATRTPVDPAPIWFNATRLLGSAPGLSSPTRLPTVAAGAASSPSIRHLGTPRISLDSVQEVSAREFGRRWNGDARSSPGPRGPPASSRNARGQMPAVSSPQLGPRGSRGISSYFSRDGSLRSPGIAPRGAAASRTPRTNKTDPIDLTDRD